LIRRTSQWLALLLFASFGLSTAAFAQKDFHRFNFTAGGGWGFNHGTIADFTDGSYNAVVGGGMNFGRHLGFDAEYMYYNLAFQDKLKTQQGLPDAHGRVQSVTLNGLLSFPLQGRLGVYAIAGGGWYQRHVSARSETLLVGTVCQPAWVLWSITCSTTTPPIILAQQTLSSRTVNAGGFNAGGGFTYQLKHPALKVFVEGRYHHANHSDVHTTMFPLTVGVKW
jgi:opacity protein-like surface antigen